MALSLDRVFLVPLLSIGGVRLCSCPSVENRESSPTGIVHLTVTVCLLLFGITTTVMTLSM